MLANFFDRNMAAASEVLNGVDPALLRSKLSKLAVGLAFDKSAATSSEGRVTLELTTDLLARFYPGLHLQPLDTEAETIQLATSLRKAAKSIHYGLDFKPKVSRVAFTLVIGNTVPPSGDTWIYVGSQGWTALLDDASPLGGLDSGNPFGAAAAACLGVARGFRLVFSDELGGFSSEGRLEFDVLHGAMGSCPVPARLPEIDLEGTRLVGLGAIGRATVWTLARAAGIQGELHGIDHDNIERSNLQRYVGSTQNDQAKSRPKTLSIEGMLKGTSVSFSGHRTTWGNYLSNIGHCDIGRVAVALDTAEDRIAVQAALPRRTLNAWTQPGDLGVSRHDFLSGPCLACLYLPDRKVRSLSENVASALGLPEAEIREKLYVGFRVDRAFLVRVEAATGVALENLRAYEGEPLSVFYTKAVCGTVHFGASRGGDRGTAAVPMAFQSALAGVLLAAEIVADVVPIRQRSTLPLTKLNILGHLGPYLAEPAGKHRSGRCLCQDPSYQSAYRAKWQESSSKC